LRLDAIEQQLTKLTTAVSELAQYVKVMDEAQTGKLTALTSQQREQPSKLPLDDETRSRLSEIEKTLAAVASQLSSREAVKLPDGSSVRRSDLDAHAMMTGIERQLATTAQSSAELAEAVKKRGRVVIDTAKLEQHAVKVLDARLAKAVAPSVRGIEQTLAGFERQAAELGAQRTVAAAQEVERVVAKADEVLAGVRGAERRLAALEGKVAWTAVGRMCLALLPLAATLLVLGGLTMGTAYALGLGPLLGWAWSSFAAANAWWHKALIALGTLTGLTVFARSVWWVAKRLADDFGRW
jgi:hypothetical protein